MSIKQKYKLEVIQNIGTCETILTFLHYVKSTKIDFFLCNGVQF